MKRKSPLLIAIAGGSGAGKSWLAERLQTSFGKACVARFSMDDFYRGPKHRSLKRRAAMNFDHPRAMDWPRVERALRALLKGRATAMPQYDFKQHLRRKETRRFEPRPIILVEGLWLWRRPALKKLFALKIYVHCPAKLRLQRRIARDTTVRGRTAAYVRWQFRTLTQPMHRRFVAPQQRSADMILRNAGEVEMQNIIARIKQEWNAQGVEVLNFGKETYENTSSGGNAAYFRRAGTGLVEFGPAVA